MTGLNTIGVVQNNRPVIDTIISWTKAIKQLNLFAPLIFLPSIRSFSMISFQCFQKLINFNFNDGGPNLSLSQNLVYVGLKKLVIIKYASKAIAEWFCFIFTIKLLFLQLACMFFITSVVYFWGLMQHHSLPIIFILLWNGIAEFVEKIWPNKS